MLVGAVVSHALGDQSHFWNLTGDPHDKLLKYFDIEGRRTFRFRVKLRADGNPAFDDALDCLDDTVRSAGGDLKAGGNIVDCHVVHAIDPNFSFAIDAFHC